MKTAIKILFSACVIGGLSWLQNWFRDRRDVCEECGGQGFVSNYGFQSPEDIDIVDCPKCRGGRG